MTAESSSTRLADLIEEISMKCCVALILLCVATALSQPTKRAAMLIIEMLGGSNTWTALDLGLFSLLFLMLAVVSHMTTLRR